MSKEILYVVESLSNEKGVEPSVIFEAIEEINKEGMTILLVEQNAHMALSVSNRGYVLQTGEIVLANDAKTLIKDPTVQKAYLGIE